MQGEMMTDSSRRPANLMNLPVGEGAPEMVHTIVEVPKGGSNKYEYDPALGCFRLDRVLYSPMHYPGEYGFIPSTLADDGDPLDILVLSGLPTYPGVLLRAWPLGFLEMRDEKGEDQKILAVPVDDPRYASYRTFDDVAAHVLNEIEHFFAIYKELEGKGVEIGGWQGKAATHDLITEAAARYQEKG